MSRSAYETCNAVKRHFDSAQYDYFKYHGKCRGRPYEKIGNQKYIFDKLGRTYRNDLANVIATAYLHQVPIKWAGDLEQESVHNAWRSHQKYIQSGTRYFKLDIETLFDAIKEHGLTQFREILQPKDEMNLPAIEQLRLSGLLEPETCVIMEVLTSFSSRIRCENPLWDDSKFLYQKFKPFFKVDVKPFAMLLRNAMSDFNLHK